MFRTKGLKTPRRNTRSFQLFNSKTDNGPIKPSTGLRDGSQPICAMATRVWSILWYPATSVCSKSGLQSTNNGIVGWQAEMDVLQDVS